MQFSKVETFFGCVKDWKPAERPKKRLTLGGRFLGWSALSRKVGKPDPLAGNALK